MTPAHTSPGLPFRLPFRRSLLALVMLLSAFRAPGGVPLRVDIQLEFHGQPLVLDALTNVTSAGQVISVTRLDFLVSGVGLRQPDGSWWEATNFFAYLSARDGRLSFTLDSAPAGSWDRLRFSIGLPPEVNHRSPNDYPANHPLHPGVNGLHWGWQGGYVFMALEGNWRQPDGQIGGYSFHLATDRQLMRVEVSLASHAGAPAEFHLAWDLQEVFSRPWPLQLSAENCSTHSRTNDFLADQLRENVVPAFRLARSAGASNAPVAAIPVPHEGSSTIVMAPDAHPYRLTISAFFPRPALPRDNPLTEEGVALGRRLFNEPRLSANDSQSCASCHEPAKAFTDGRAVSLGAEGKSGTRSAMPLLNLAWKASFFWDGRAPSLREQVLQPIQNPIEMHESLPHVVAKLAGAPEYPELFRQAFGSPAITADRLSRALEQFLLVQVSHNSKFDRVIAGTAQLSAEEQRGFELFHTEYDPRHGQFGADCFHCHGGPLFQSQAFANNGLDATPKDSGRAIVTHRDGDHGKFAVPSLRNVAVTAPYMHDGRFPTLAAVVTHYCTGIAHHPTLDPNLAKHPEGGLNLTAADQQALVAFLETLTDERFVPTSGLK